MMPSRAQHTARPGVLRDLKCWASVMPMLRIFLTSTAAEIMKQVCMLLQYRVLNTLAAANFAAAAPR